MQEPNVRPFRILGVAHVMVGILLLPLTMFFGLLLAPVLLPGRTRVGVWLRVRSIVLVLSLRTTGLRRVATSPSRHLMGKSVRREYRTRYGSQSRAPAS